MTNHTEAHESSPSGNDYPFMAIGIDPGKNGGVAFARHRPGCPPIRFAFKMPETSTDLVHLLCHWEPEAICFPYLEKVHSSPQMGVVSAFTFGQGFGRIEAALGARQNKCPSTAVTRYVRPQEWQKAMDCMTGGDKNITKRLAQEQNPTLKVTHALADALLIAEFGRLSILGEI